MLMNRFGQFAETRNHLVAMDSHRKLPGPTEGMNVHAAGNDQPDGSSRQIAISFDETVGHFARFGRHGLVRRGMDEPVLDLHRTDVDGRKKNRHRAPPVVLGIYGLDVRNCQISALLFRLLPFFPYAFLLFLPYFLFFLYVSIHKGDVSRYNTDTDLSIRSLSGHHDPIVMQGLRTYVRRRRCCDGKRKPEKEI